VGATGPVAQQPGSAGPTATAAATPPPEDREDDRGADPLDREQIDLLLSLDGGEGLTLSEIVDEYLAHGEKGMHELRRVLTVGDVESLERAAHTLKGASANVGASAMAELCAALESSARAAELDEASGLMDRCDHEFARVQDALRLVTVRA
jgi:HPt (histidine-containing phosphotransfer) domain-containing protein